MKLRGHYLAWLAAAVGTAVLLGLALDLSVVQITGGTIGLDLIPLLYACVVVPPAVYRWRKHGEVYHRFRELEHALHHGLHSQIDRATSRFDQILDFIARIDHARGLDRQLVRNEAKAWLREHGALLSREERDFVADHLGYLHKP
jgi:hypothetical protein